MTKKRIALIISFRDFRDEEYFISKEVFQLKGVKIKTFSFSLGTAIGKFGGEVKVDELVENLDINKFEAVIFIGGPGMAKRINDDILLKVTKEAKKKEKIIGAICIAPLILLNAGLSKGKKATVWSSSKDKSAVNLLKEKGAIYQNDNVVLDEKIITGSGPDFTKEFAKKILELL